MYLTRNRHGVYYYRRPIVAEDQRFWLGDNGSGKREWSRSLRTKDRREAVAVMADAADEYDAERDTHLRRWRAGGIVEAAQLSAQEREELEALDTLAAESIARREARMGLRVERRKRLQMSTAELSQEEAAWHDLVRERDATIEALTLASEGQRAVNQRIAGSPAVPGHGRTVEALLAAYEADKGPRWSPSSKKAVKPVFRFLRDVFAGRAVESITREEAREAVQLLQTLPFGMGRRKELAGLNVREAIKMGAQLGIPAIKAKTVNDGYLIHTVSAFGWAMREQWLASNPFIGLSVHDPVDDADRRDPFTSAQLTKLFSAAPWDRPWPAQGKKQATFWVPLLCLFHGLRNGEAAGLRVADITVLDGLPVLLVRPYDGRSIKTAWSRATLPIHPALLALGFLAFVDQRAGAGVELLFPEGIANSRGQVAAKLGERFSQHVRRLGLEGRKLGTHSLRHNFEDALREAELPERTSLALARRKEPGSSRGYGDGLSARQKAEGLERVVYPGLDLSHLHHGQGRAKER